MKAHIYALLILSLGLASCKKDTMSPKECQDKYNEIMTTYNNEVEDATDAYTTNQITVYAYRDRLRNAADAANQSALSLVDCMGWQLIDPVD